MTDGHGGSVVNRAGQKVGPCSFCPAKRVVLAVKDEASGGVFFFCRRCCVRCEVRGADGVVRDPTHWPDLIGTEAELKPFKHGSFSTDWIGGDVPRGGAEEIAALRKELDELQLRHLHETRQLREELALYAVAEMNHGRTEGHEARWPVDEQAAELARELDADDFAFGGQRRKLQQTVEARRTPPTRESGGE